MDLARENCGPHRRRRQDQAKPAYTLAEYNQYKAADKEANPQQKVKLLDAFVKEYPNSTLMPYVYRDYYTTYMALKNFAQAIEYADRMIALGDKIDTTGRLEAYYTRAQAFYLGAGRQSVQTPDALTKARDAAVAGLKTLDDLEEARRCARRSIRAAKEGLQGSVQCGRRLGFDDHEGLRRGGRILQDCSVHRSE